MTARRSSRRSARLLAACLLCAGVAALTVVSACSAGQITQTSSQVPAVPGANAHAGPNGEIALRDLFVAYNSPAGYPRGGSAPLIVRIFNDGPQPVRLVRVSAGEAADSVQLMDGVPATPSPTPTAVATASANASPDATASAAPTPTTPARPAGQESFVIEIAPSSFVLLVPGQGRYLQLTGLAGPLTPGASVALTFTFDDGVTAVVEVPFGLPTQPAPRGSVEVHQEE